MNTKIKTSLRAGTMITGALFFASVSQAQTVNSSTQPDRSAPTAPTAPADVGGVQDIVVTAQRKSENLQRAPIAITAIGGDQLRNAGVVRPQDITALVP